jgi:hypothetical protein
MRSQKNSHRIVIGTVEDFVPALQAGLSNAPETQGVALGYVIPALQAEDRCHS